MQKIHVGCIVVFYEVGLEVSYKWSEITAINGRK